MKINDIIFELHKEEFNEIYFPLNKKFLNPIFISHENSFNGGFSCMLDSGAAIPVWCTGVITLTETRVLGLI